ncbi:TPA: hypothetical protein NI842_001205 [Legionella pneumophila]|nr:hypothetical protein D7259_13165 [Legionella pneumophila]HAT9350036.1 hypothetical protein [Legionella pneumophila subsp. pneumophila]RYB60619.1 hypothetical protein D7264_10940 [Legionella pneumophila]RYV53987.1 hypothetical protein D7261_13425 [Legionella pneumophila]RYV54302.1 hypothetical protein D7253_13340 [Legionella pneumophila]
MIVIPHEVFVSKSNTALISMRYIVTTGNDYTLESEIMSVKPNIQTTLQNGKPLPYQKIGNQKVASFKDPNKPPYGPFANTTNAGEFPLKQTVLIHGIEYSFIWPSSEHAFHAQKLIHLMNKLGINDPNQGDILNTLRKIEKTQDQAGQQFDPRKNWDPIARELATNMGITGSDISIKAQFDALCDSDYHSKGGKGKGIDPATGEPYTRGFMATVLRLKCDQNPELKELAMRCASEGILPIEASQAGKTGDVNWASGIDGSGRNMLGIEILKLGNQYLMEAGRGNEIKIADPDKTYEDLQRSHQKDLGHDAIIGKPWSNPLNNSLNIWYDSTRKQTVVESHRGSNLQLILKDGKPPKAIWRKDENSPWQDGDFKRPAVQSLLQAYQDAGSPVPTVAKQQPHPAQLNDRWAKVHKQHHDNPVINLPLFKQELREGVKLELNKIEAELKKGINPLFSRNESHLERIVREYVNPAVLEASKILAAYSVKNAMHDLNTSVTVSMVDNNRAHDIKHPLHAMKIQFKDNAEAKQFAEKLLNEYGIHSHTFGKGIMKTPQNGAIYLTPKDLQMLSQLSGLAKDPLAGLQAFANMAKNYDKAKEVSIKEDLESHAGLSP